jgi:hypothetical protein
MPIIISAHTSAIDLHAISSVDFDLMRTITPTIPFDFDELYA